MSDNLIATSNIWAKDERAMLTRLASLIIGKDPRGLMPGVEDELIMSNILARTEGFERPVRKGLASLVKHVGKLGLTSVVEFSDEALTSMLNAQRETQSLLRAMMQIVAQCYYADERVLLSLGFEARPPFPQGHELEQGDWQLLEPVKKGPQRYRSV